MKLRWFAAPFALALVVANPQARAQQPVTPQDQAERQVTDLVRSLKPQHGLVAIPQAHASLDLGDAYDFYGPDDARKILVSVWGNPPDVAEGVLGLVMQAGKSPLSNAWGAVVTYEDTGYVSDDDASKADYDDILKSLKDNTEQANEQRRKDGYPVMHVAGWAEAPHYDNGTHSVVWARDLEIEGNQQHSLNYDLRTLGRKGVLSVNLVSAMPDLAEVHAAAAMLASHASFDIGLRYADYDPSKDRKAEYGVAGLVAAGVGVAAAKKLGLLAIGLKFFKPLAIAVAALFATMRKRIARLFGRGED